MAVTARRFVECTRACGTDVLVGMERSLKEGDNDVSNKLCLQNIPPPPHHLYVDLASVINNNRMTKMTKL